VAINAKLCVCVCACVRVCMCVCDEIFSTRIIKFSFSFKLVIYNSQELKPNWSNNTDCRTHDITSDVI
jgi:hypothetical protein